MKRLFPAVLFLIFLGLQAGTIVPKKNDPYAAPRVTKPWAGSVRVGITSNKKISNPAPDKIKATGSVKFDVLLPRSRKKILVDANKFGVSTSNPDNSKSFIKAIKHAKKINASHMTLKKGTYHFKNINIEFNGFEDFVFDGNNSTFVFSKPGVFFGQYLGFKNCKRSIFKNFNVSWNYQEMPNLTVAKLKEINNKGRYIDFQAVEPGFFRKNAYVHIFMPINPKTLNIGLAGQSWGHYGNFKNQKVINKNTLRVFLNKKLSKSVFDGYKKILKTDLFYQLHHYYYKGCGVSLKYSSHITFDHVHVFRTTGHGFLCNNIDHVDFYRCKVLPPDEDKRKYSLSSQNDQFHIFNTSGYLKFRECDIGLGGDDCINIHDNISMGIKKISKRKMIITRGQSWAFPYKLGDKLEFLNKDFSKTGVIAKIISLKKDKASKHKIIVTDVDLPDTLTKETIVRLVKYYSANIIIKNCYLHENRGRAFLIQADNVTVSGNKFYANTHSPLIISSGAEKRWAEGYGANNILIENNQFINPNIIHRGYYDFGKKERASAIYIRSFKRIFDRYIFKNIVFKNNTFVNMPASLIFASSVENLAIRGNTIINNDEFKVNSPLRNSIELTKAKNIDISNNVFSVTKKFKLPGVYYTPDSVSGILIKNNKVKYIKK